MMIRSATTALASGFMAGFSAFWLDDAFSLTASPAAVGKAIGAAWFAFVFPALQAWQEYKRHPAVGRNIVWTGETSGTIAARPQTPRGMLQAASPIWPDEPVLEGVRRVSLQTGHDHGVIRPDQIVLSWRQNGTLYQERLPGWMTRAKLLTIAWPVHEGIPATWELIQKAEGKSRWTHRNFTHFLGWADDRGFIQWINPDAHQVGWLPINRAFWVTAYYYAQKNIKLPSPTG